jgi:bacterioferritin-associated ferredoxin
MYVCLCKGLTESDVRKAGVSGCVTARQIMAEFGLREEGCCGRCAKNICQLVSLAQCPLDSAFHKTTASR